MANKLPISVCIIAKNEERYLDDCLKRLKPYGFDIVITDTGSSDKTKEIAKKYTNKVYDFEWIDDFSAARNFCASHASYPWVIALDCDEYMEQLDIAGIKMLIQRFPKSTGIIKLDNLLYDKERNLRCEKENVTRVYNRNFYEFVGDIHEQIRLKNPDENIGNILSFIVPAQVVHHGYAVSVEEMNNKQLRNLKLLYQRIENGSEDAYTYFQIGQSEYLIGDYEKALDAFKKGLALNPPVNSEYGTYIIMGVAKSYGMSGDMDSALKVMSDYAQECESLDFKVMHAKMLYSVGKTMEALLLFLQIVTLPGKDDLGEGLMDCYERIAYIYHSMGEDEMAKPFDELYEKLKSQKDKIVNSAVVNS